MTTPAEFIAAIEAKSRVEKTPCGDGKMVWHIWGGGPPLVMMHGGYGSWTHWIRNVEVLSKHFTVLAPDTPGLGDSAMPPDPVTPESLAGIISSGLDILVAPSAPVRLAGFSFGAVLGSHVAGIQGERLASLTIIDGGFMGLPRQPMAAMSNWRAAETPETLQAAQRRNLSILMIANPENIDELAIHIQTENTKRGRIKSTEVAKPDTVLQALPRVKARISGIWGERDATCVGQIDKREAVLRGFQPDCDFRVIPDAGHWVMYEAADAFNATLLDMLHPS